MEVQWFKDGRQCLALLKAGVHFEALGGWGHERNRVRAREDDWDEASLYLEILHADKQPDELSDHVRKLMKEVRVPFESTANGIQIGKQTNMKVEGRGAMADIQPEEFALHSGRIGGPTVLAADGVEPMVIRTGAKCSSDVFMIHARANMEGLRWVSASVIRATR